MKKGLLALLLILMLGFAGSSTLMADPGGGIDPDNVVEPVEMADPGGGIDPDGVIELADPGGGITPVIYSIEEV